MGVTVILIKDLFEYNLTNHFIISKFRIEIQAFKLKNQKKVKTMWNLKLEKEVKLLIEI